MRLTVVMFALAVFLCVTALLSGAGRRLDEKRARLRYVRADESGAAQKNMSAIRQRRAELKKNRKKRREAKAQAGKGNRKDGKKTPDELMLERAGIPLSGTQFSLLKLLLAAVLIPVCLLVGVKLGLEAKMLLLLVACAVLCGLMVPGKIIQAKINARQTACRDGLPDVMDMLAVSVEAGLGFDAAIARLYENDKSPVMQELMRAQRDVRHGMSKKDAYNSLAERCNVKEVTAFVKALLQAEEMGVSVKSVLKSQSDALRESRRQRAEEKALKAPVTMMIPMVLFIFPTIFIILLGPAVINMLDVFG